MPIFRLRFACFAAGVSFLAVAPTAIIHAQPAYIVAEAGSPDDPVEELSSITVKASPPLLPDQFQLPSTVQTLSAATIEDTVNAVDLEDALKYQPSLFVRKRNDGDNQAVLATRTWGVNSSARSLVYADGVLLSALIANNNTIGAPRWGMVCPEEMQNIDIVYGPYSAAYPGNSMGAVVEITTRMPDKAEASLSTTQTWQDFSLYSTRNTYLANQSALTAGDRAGKWSFWISASLEDSTTQPLLFATAATLPAATTGGIVAWNKLGQPADLLGATGLQHEINANAEIKLAYDFSPTLRATYALAGWNSDVHSTVQTYLRDASGQPTYAGVASFASGFYTWTEEQTMQSLTLKSAGAGDFDWQLIGSIYDFDKDTQKSPVSASSSGTAFSAAGKVALLGGTGWQTGDAKAAWYPQGHTGGQEISFGAHYDKYALVNPTYNTPDWQAGRIFTSLATEGNGNTNTDAIWAQDAWRFAPDWKLTVGARGEEWRAFDGINVSGATRIVQPKESSDNLSPKATLSWTPAQDWTVAASAGGAYRYPTAGELYQLVSTGTTYTSPNPDLKPERDASEEVRLERKRDDRLLRLTVFEEDTNDALVSQYAGLVPGSSTQYQYVMNVGEIRNRGVEIFLDQNHVLMPGLELSGSVTYVNSRILADAGQGQYATAVGKKAPYVPMWRATFVATYRPTDHLAWTVAGRYSGQQYSTVDNTDVNPNAFGGFDEFFVLDTHVNWMVNRRWSVSGGVDNLLNRKYFLYHPFPQRTAVVGLKFGY